MSPVESGSRNSAEAETQIQMNFVRIQNITGKDSEISVSVDPARIKTVGDLCSWDIVRGCFREDQLLPPTSRLQWLKVVEESSDVEGEDEAAHDGSEPEEQEDEFVHMGEEAPVLSHQQDVAGEDGDSASASKQPRAADKSTHATTEFLARDVEIEYDSPAAVVAYQFVVTAGADWPQVIQRKIEGAPSPAPPGGGSPDAAALHAVDVLFTGAITVSDARDFLYDLAYLNLEAIQPDSARDFCLQMVADSLPWLTNAPPREGPPAVGEGSLCFNLAEAAMELPPEEWAKHAKITSDHRAAAIVSEERKDFGKRALVCYWNGGLPLAHTPEDLENIERESRCAEAEAFFRTTLDTCQLAGEPLANAIFREGMGHLDLSQESPKRRDLCRIARTTLEWLRANMGAAAVWAFLDQMGTLLSVEQLAESWREFVADELPQEITDLAELRDSLEQYRDRAECDAKGARTAVALFYDQADALGFPYPIGEDFEEACDYLEGVCHCAAALEAFGIDRLFEKKLDNAAAAEQGLTWDFCFEYLRGYVSE
ncbi:unnamed protein product [Amoebophrya sp. A120]|nr:unnamed protein product [Amoebophrya sp. A120]|eukprot:GSA120T00003319001.1